MQRMPFLSSFWKQEIVLLRVWALDFLSRYMYRKVDIQKTVQRSISISGAVLSTDRRTAFVLIPVNAFSTHHRDLDVVWGGVPKRLMVMIPSLGAAGKSNRGVCWSLWLSQWKKKMIECMTAVFEPAVVALPLLDVISLSGALTRVPVVLASSPPPAQLLWISVTKRQQYNVSFRCYHAIESDWSRRNSVYKHTHSCVDIFLR